MIKLFDYQTEALAAEHEHRASVPEENRLAIVMATGLGKTTIMGQRAINHVETHPRSRVLILVHTDELTWQAEARMREMAADRGWTVGVVKANRDEVSADIIVASVQTLASPSRRRRIADVGLVIVDECHHATAQSYLDILGYFRCFGLRATLVDGKPVMEEQQPFTFRAGSLSDPIVRPTPVLGLTATLERGDGQGLGSVWQDVAFTRGISWAVRHGWLVQPVGYRLEIPGADFSTESEARLDQQMIDSLAPEAIVKKWLELAADRQTVAFMPLVASATALAAAFLANGVQAAVIHGKMPDARRKAVVAEWNAGRIQVLCNAMVLTEGFDPQPDLEYLAGGNQFLGHMAVIIGRPTKNRRLFIQMVGRGLRPDRTRPTEDQDCLLLVVADSITDTRTVADLSDKPLDSKTQGALTVMEDQWDIGAGLLEDPAHVWLGKVDATQFDPLAARSSKVWMRTKRGVPFISLGDRRYVFVVGTSSYFHDVANGRAKVAHMAPAHLDVESALIAAEGRAEDLGGDLGRLVADKSRPWRNQRPSQEMQDRARQLGLGPELDKIMAARAGGKAGKVSDLITKVLASRALDKFAERINEL